MADTKINTDVVIVGKGISGLILSILLQEKGIDHILLDRVGKKKITPLPETIPPSALVLLESLNLLELFEKSSSKTFGYHSIWGSDTIVDNNFFYHNPYKYGLKLNKQTLLNDLEEIVKDKIVKFNDIIEINGSVENVSVKIKSNNAVRTINSRLIIDATGRNRNILKHLGIASEENDNLVALSCLVPRIKHPKLTHSVFVESFENGWGIVSSLNEQVNGMTIFTQQRNPILPQLKSYRHWKEALTKTKILKDFLSDDLDRKVAGGDANSSRASKIAGSNWLAIGDAAISFDPLSSHGISNAIYCSSASSKAIESYLKDDSEIHFQNYENTLAQIFEEYLKHKEKLYDSEKRWKESPFWNDNVFAKPAHY